MVKNTDESRQSGKHNATSVWIGVNGWIWLVTHSVKHFKWSWRLEKTIIPFTIYLSIVHVTENKLVTGSKQSEKECGAKNMAMFTAI